MVKKIQLLLVTLFLSAATSFAQQESEVYSFGNSSYSFDSIPKLPYRNIAGGGVILVNYVGDGWIANPEAKNAMEHACRIWEEQLPTALPIYIDASFGNMRGNNPLAKTTVKLAGNGIPRALAKHYFKQRYFDQCYEEASEDTLFFKKSDAIITFSNKDIFSFSLDYVVENKYDFVTIALRELAKVFGFYNNICQSSTTDNQLELRDINPTPYITALFRGYMNPNDQSAAFNYATSGNVNLSGYPNNYSLYAPTNYEDYASLSYFAIDEKNLDTRILQPNIPKGTSIRRIGEPIIGLLKDYANWCDFVIVGDKSTDVSTTGSAANTAITYNQTQSFSKTISKDIQKDNLNNVKSVFITSNNKLGSEKTLSNDLNDVNAYINKFADYPYLNDDWGYKGWSISVLRKDGTWDIVKTGHFLESKIDFSTSILNTSNATNYARTSDGYLRCRVSYQDDEYGFSSLTKTFSKYFLANYLPQKPELTSAPITTAKAMGIDSNDDYEENVKIAFRNVEGTKRMLVEEMVEGDAVPFTYYIDDCIKQGYFIATIDKGLSSSFRLRAINDNGVTISEELIIPASITNTYSLDASVQDNDIQLLFRNVRNNLVSDKKVATTFQISNLSNSSINASGFAHDNKINIQNLPHGIYGLKVLDKEGKIYNTKLIK